MGWELVKTAEEAKSSVSAWFLHSRAHIYAMAV